MIKFSDQALAASAPRQTECTGAPQAAMHDFSLQELPRNVINHLMAKLNSSYHFYCNSNYEDTRGMFSRLLLSLLGCHDIDDTCAAHAQRV